MSENTDEVLSEVENYGTVILMDSLGTKGIWKNKEEGKELAERWNKLVKAIESSFDNYRKDFGVKPEIYAISDTMIITILGSDKDIILYLSGLISGTAIETGLIFNIYLRGCISMGSIFPYKNMILGSAIDEASEYYEKGNWVGVFTTPSAHSALTRFKPQSEKKSVTQFIEYGVPTKDGIVRTWAVRLSNKFDPEIIEITNTATLIETIHMKMESGNYSNGLEKWKNTLDFMYTTYPQNSI